MTIATTRDRHADGDHSCQAREDRRERHQGNGEGHRAEHHLLLMIPLPLERLLALVVPLDDALLDPLDEGVDHGGLQLGTELLARLDRGLGSLHGRRWARPWLDFATRRSHIAARDGVLFYGCRCRTASRRSASCRRPGTRARLREPGCLHDADGGSAAATTGGAGSRAGSSSADGIGAADAAGCFTELFFLDEATAFAAGHRPARSAAARTTSASSRSGASSTPARSAPTRSTRSSTRERVDPHAAQRPRPAFADLPDGAFVLLDGRAAPRPRRQRCCAGRRRLRRRADRPGLRR